MMLTTAKVEISRFQNHLEWKEMVPVTEKLLRWRLIEREIGTTYSKVIGNYIKSWNELIIPSSTPPNPQSPIHRYFVKRQDCADVLDWIGRTQSVYQDFPVAWMSSISTPFFTFLWRNHTFQNFFTGNTLFLKSWGYIWFFSLFGLKSLWSLDFSAADFIGVVH